MIERLTELKAYRAEAECECGGTLVSNGMCLTMSPPIYPHFCDTCGERESLDRVYPAVVHR